MLVQISRGNVQIYEDCNDQPKRVVPHTAVTCHVLTRGAFGHIFRPQDLSGLSLVRSHNWCPVSVRWNLYTLNQPTYWHLSGSFDTTYSYVHGTSWAMVLLWYWGVSGGAVKLSPRGVSISSWRAFDAMKDHDITAACRLSQKTAPRLEENSCDKLRNCLRPTFPHKIETNFNRFFKKMLD